MMILHQTHILHILLYIYIVYNFIIYIVYSLRVHDNMVPKLDQFPTQIPIPALILIILLIVALPDYQLTLQIQKKKREE
jgi:uncharacterized membrane protein YbjE (DUF340 family)